MQQITFDDFASLPNDGHGGALRSTTRGRGRRPLSKSLPVHFVLVANPERLVDRTLRTTRSVALVQELAEHYAAKFRVPLERLCVRDDQIHLILRPSRRSMVQSYFRVLAGQIAQKFASEELLEPLEPAGRFVLGGTKLWKYRPWSRVLTDEQARRLALLP